MKAIKKINKFINKKINKLINKLIYNIKKINKHKKKILIKNYAVKINYKNNNKKKYKKKKIKM